MNHSFDVEFAREYGIEEAIMIQNFHFWISKNKANGRHEHDGRTWTYNSAKAMTELMPYLSDRQIRRTLDSLVEKGVLIKGNWNESAYDRTLWFAFADESKFQIGHHHSPKSAETFAEIGDSKTDLNQIENTDTKPSAASKTTEATAQKFERPSWVPEDEWADFEEVRRKKKKPLTDRARALAVKQLMRLRDDGQDVREVIEQSVLHSWDSFYEVKRSMSRSSGVYGRGDDNRPRLVL